MNIKNIRDNVVSYLRNSDRLSLTKEYFENAIYEMDHGNEYVARQQLNCAIAYLEKGDSTDRKAADMIRNSI